MFLYARVELSYDVCIERHPSDNMMSNRTNNIKRKAEIGSGLKMTPGENVLGTVSLLRILR